MYPVSVPNQLPNDRIAKIQTSFEGNHNASAPYIAVDSKKSNEKCPLPVSIAFPKYAIEPAVNSAPVNNIASLLKIFSGFDFLLRSPK